MNPFTPGSLIALLFILLVISIVWHLHTWWVARRYLQARRVFGTFSGKIPRIRVGQAQERVIAALIKSYQEKGFMSSDHPLVELGVTFAGLNYSHLREEAVRRITQKE